jgi:hypothetical protein
MFLSQQRNWFKVIEPTVVCLSTYIYGEQEIDNPFIVGKNLIESNMQDVAGGIVYKDTRVAGIHPYSGGRLIVCIVLCKSVTSNYLANTLEFVEKVAGVFNENITKLIGNYLKIANVVIGGIDKLLDANDIQPLFGFRKEFDRDANDYFAPGYYVMIDKSTVEWEPGNFFVKENQLFIGKDQASAVPFRNDEYVLYSITRSDTRSDIKLLPIWQSYKKILDALKVPEVSQELKDRVKGMLRVLNVEIRESPDFTQPHAQNYIKDLIKEVGNLIEPKFNWSASPKKSKDFWDSMDSEIQAI